MADFTQIIQEINADINTNGVGAITGAKLNEVLRDMIAAVNAAKQDPLTIDATPTEDSTNPVQSGGVYDFLQSKASLYYVEDITDIPPTILNRLQVGDVVRFGNDFTAGAIVTVIENGQMWLVVPTDRIEVFVYDNGSYSGNATYNLSDFATKAAGATNGNLAELNSFGDITDSGIAASDVATTSDLAGKQDTISDLSTIRSGAAAGATAYQKPSGGIPKTDLASGVQTSLGKADTAFQKPSGGIPESDLSSDVQQALQKHFKGWYVSSSNLPANPVVGDYAYVKGATASDPAAIYECTTAGTWSNSGRTADTSNVQTFASGEEVNEIGIDDEPTADSDNLVKSSGVEKALCKKIRELNNTIPIKFNIDNIANGLLSSVTGAVTAAGNTRYIYTPDYYPVTAGNEIIVCCYGTGSAAGCCFYDENKTFISGEAGKSSINSKIKYTVPANACYVRLCSEQNTRQLSIFCLSPNVDVTPSENSDDLITSGGVYVVFHNLDERVTLNSQYIDLQNSYDANNVGYYNLLWTEGIYINENGGVSNDANYEATLDYIPVKSGDIIWCDLVVIGQGDYVVVYDSDKQYVNRYYGSVKGFEITIEQDGYIRFCNRTVSNNNPKVILKNSSLFNIIKELQEQIDEAAKYVYRRISISNLETGLLNANGVPFMTTDNRYKYCPDYFRVFTGETVVTNASATGSAYGIVFYDNQKTKLSVEHSATTAGIVVPQGAVYVRFCKEYYDASTGLWAKKVEDEYIDPLVDELDSRVTALENGNETLRTKPFFNIGLDTWIADEEVKNFFPNTQKLNSKYNGEVSPEKRYIAIGFDDFRATDFSMIIPLFDKYGAKAVFNRVHNSVDISENDIIRVNSLINGSHEIGDHTWLHYKYPFDEPLMNGQDPSSPEGNQVPFPSNDQLRNDAGDGKNVFGRTLTNNVKTDLGYQAPDIDTTWAAMTDAQCQQFRDYFSVMKDTSTNLIDVLDALSNLYLGTTGSSRGSWDGTNNEYTGGIFTGCKTSCNHEIWERVLLVTNRFLKDKFGLNYNLITWSLPGSKGSGCYFPYNGNQYFDTNHTKRVGNLARFESSLYKNNDGSAKNRSWTDVLREYGYKTTHDATPTTRNSCMSYQFIMNGQQSRPDALLHPTNRLLSYSQIASEYTKGTDLQGTAPYEVQMYDGGANSNKNSFRNEVEQWRHSTANGIIWGAVIDSNDTWSERMILEGLLKYGVKTGIEFVTHAEAYDICFNHPIKNGNLIYNPRLRNTAKEFMPTATTVPSNPDGYRGECSVSIVNGTPVLTTTGETDYRHYGIPYGKVKYSADVKGNGSIEIRAIKNNTNNSSVKTSSVLLDTINISNNDYTPATSELTIPDNGVGVYDDVYGGYGDKIIGLYIEYSSGLQVKNIDLRLI